MSEVLTAPGQATPEWLTKVLRQGGQLPNGHVTGVRVSSTEPTSVWTLFHLQVRYSAAAPPSAREHLILKLSRRTGQHGDTRFYALASGKEVFFYTNIAATPAMANVPIIRCVHSAHSPRNRGPISWSRTYPIPTGNRRSRYPHTNRCVSRQYGVWHTSMRHGGRTDG